MFRLFENLQKITRTSVSRSLLTASHFVGLSKLDTEDLCTYHAQTLEQYWGVWFLCE